MSGCFLDGFKYFLGRFKYSPPYWDDMRVPATATTRGAANPPTFIQFVDNGSGSVGVFANSFSQTLTEDLFFEAQLPHRYYEGTSLKPHIHWSPSLAMTVGDVYWGLEYTVATVGVQFPLTQILTVVVPASAVVRYHDIAILPDIPMPNNKISTMITGRIYRFGNSPLDTYPGGAFLHEIDFHFQLDTPGSRQEFTK